MAEIACQVILRVYHGYGLALPLALHSMRRADAQPLTGQFARALGCHKISQKTLKGMGFTACGFLLNVVRQISLPLSFPKRLLREGTAVHRRQAPGQ